MEIAIISLSIITIGLIIERYLFAREMTKRLGDAVKAVMSRNINEYISATTEPKHDESMPESDEVELSEADDKTFNKYLSHL